VALERVRIRSVLEARQERSCHERDPKRKPREHLERRATQRERLTSSDATQAQ
jgi:hypothetical protein